MSTLHYVEKENCVDQMTVHGRKELMGGGCGSEKEESYISFTYLKTGRTQDIKTWK